MRNHIAGFALAVATLVSPQAFGCTISISANTNVPITWGLSFAYMGVNFDITKTDEPACDVAVGFGKGGAADYNSRNAEGLKYQLYKDSGQGKILKDVPDIASADNVLLHPFPAGTNLVKTFTYYVGIPFGNATSPLLTAAGLYQNTFTINVYESSGPPGGGAIPIASGNVTLQITAETIAKAAIVPAGSTWEEAAVTPSLNLGSLYQGKTYTFAVRMLANTNYTVACTSNNGGKLVTTAPDPASEVPYAINMLSNNGGVTSLSGNSHNVQITIGNTSSSRGNLAYTDTITCTPSAP